jgi:gag-polypeptide of LTR copia-type
MSSNAAASGSNATSANITGTAATPAAGLAPHANGNRGYRRFNLPSLEEDGSNFVFWKHHIHRALCMQKLWNLVDGSLPRPAPNAPDLNDWLEKDEDAQGQIEFCVKNEPLESILRSMSAKESWDLLCEHYEGQGKQCIIGLINTVFHMQFSDAEPLEPQLNRFTSQIYLINQLKAQTTFNNEFTAIKVATACTGYLSFFLEG